MLLADRVAIITGGAKGIGRGIALKFAEEGCTVVIADIDQKSAAATIAEVTQKGGRRTALAGDALDIKQVKAVVDKTIAQFGKIDILINNAGGMTAPPTPIEDMPEADWDKVLTLNLLLNENPD
jgi:2-deoxy-D-gluconate 3-dehydrogenase